jgi:hypothetical protein
MRGEKEDAMRAIERLRREKVNVKTAMARDWDRYQSSLYASNRLALLEAMGYGEDA